MSAKNYKRGTAQKDDPTKQLSNSELDLPFVKGPAVIVLPLVVGALIGIALCYFFFSKQAFWVEPLIGNSVKATVGAQTLPAPVVDSEPLPTCTPYPTYTPQPPLPTYTPGLMAAAQAPAARIISPQYPDGPLPVQTKATVGYENIPEGRFLWVVVRVPKVKPVWYVYPQLLDGIPEPGTGSGTLVTTLQLGIQGPQDSGEPFDIVVLLLDEEAQEIFSTYAQDCMEIPSDPLKCGGLRLPDAGVQILDFATVVRE